MERIGRFAASHLASGREEGHTMTEFAERRAHLHDMHASGLRRGNVALGGRRASSQTGLWLKEPAWSLAEITNPASRFDFKKTHAGSESFGFPLSESPSG
jgi:hypothetical protein